MRFHALGTEFRVHFLTLLSALLAVALGVPKEMLTVAADPAELYIRSSDVNRPGLQFAGGFGRIDALWRRGPAA